MIDHLAVLFTDRDPRPAGGVQSRLLRMIESNAPARLAIRALYDATDAVVELIRAAAHATLPG